MLSSHTHILPPPILLPRVCVCYSSPLWDPWARSCMPSPGCNLGPGSAPGTKRPIVSKSWRPVGPTASLLWWIELCPSPKVPLKTPTPVNVNLLGNEVSADVIKLRWGHPRLAWAFNPTSGVLIRRRRDFLGGPMDETPSSQCRGPRFDPW